MSSSISNVWKYGDKNQDSENSFTLSLNQSEASMYLGHMIALDQSKNFGGLVTIDLIIYL